MHGSYAADILPGLVIMALGLGAVFAGVQTAANAGVPADKAGLAAALITASYTIGGALGLAIFAAIATSRTHHEFATHASVPAALTSGFHLALTACTLFLIAAALVASALPTPAANLRPAPCRVPSRLGRPREVAGPAGMRAEPAVRTPVAAVMAPRA